MYSSADKVFIIICVSKIMNTQNKNAPPSEMIISKVVEWKKICKNPPNIKIPRPANKLHKIFVDDFLSVHCKLTMNT